MSSENTSKQYCNIPTDGTCVSIGILIKSKDCLIPPGSCFTSQEIILDDHGHEINGDWEKNKEGDWVINKGKCKHSKKIKKVMKQEAQETQEQTSIKTSVEVANIDPVVPLKKTPSSDASITLIVGIISGIIGSSVGPLIKDFLKKKIKKEEKNEITDCKTHQINTNTKFSSISNRITTLENKLKKDSNFDIDLDQINDLKDRIEKLEKDKK